MRGRELSRELRRGDGDDLRRRRGIVGLTMAAIGAMGVVALYQTGIIERIPEPPLPGLDAEEVDASAEAYERFDTPDAVIGLNSYGTTMMLAAMGGSDRARTRPWIPLVLAGKTLFDAAQAGKLTYDQWTKHRSFCSWCLLASAATLATVPLALPEARRALETLLDR